MGSKSRPPNSTATKTLLAFAPWVRSQRYVAMASTGPVLLPSLPRLRSRPGFLRRFHHKVQGKVGGIPSSFDGEADGEASSEEVPRYGDQLWRVCGVPHGQTVAGEGGESGDCELWSKHAESR